MAVGTHEYGRHNRRLSVERAAATNWCFDRSILVSRHPVDPALRLPPPQQATGEVTVAISLARQQSFQSFESPMSLPDHLIAVVKRIRGTPISAPPSPWRCTGSFSVGGLTDVGFGTNSDLLLVISSTGRGVIDCTTGEKVAREYGDGDWHDTLALEAKGIGPLADQTMKTAGLYGGGLPRTSVDGWTTEDFMLDWPDHTLLLLPPGAWAYGDGFNKPANYTKVAVESELRAWGFSPTGRCLVLATTSDLTCWHRDP